MLFTGLIAFLGVLANVASAQERLPIIDMHLHSYDESNYFVAPDRYGTMAPPTAEAHFEATCKTLRDNNIVLGVVSNSASSQAAWLAKDVDGRLLRGFGWFRPACITAIRCLSRTCSCAIPG
jgi:hypothetical protein